MHTGGSVAEWLACWTQAQKAWVQIAATMLSGNSLRQTVHTHRASVHQAAKLVAVLLTVARVTAGLAESNGSLPPGLWLTSPAGWLPRTGISSGTLHSVMKYGLPFLHMHNCTLHLHQNVFTQIREINKWRERNNAEMVKNITEWYEMLF